MCSFIHILPFKVLVKSSLILQWWHFNKGTPIAFNFQLWSLLVLSFSYISLTLITSHHIAFNHLFRLNHSIVIFVCIFVIFLLSWYLYQCKQPLSVSKCSSFYLQKVLIESYTSSIILAILVTVARILNLHDFHTWLVIASNLGESCIVWL